MTFKIGDIVKNNSDNCLIVLATKETELNEDNLSELNRNGTLKIVNVDLLATGRISAAVKDYKLGKISSFNNDGWAILDNEYLFQEYFEEELFF